MKKNLLLVSSLFLTSGLSFAQAQQTYDDYSGKKFLTYGPKNGTLDTAFKNPSPAPIDNSPNCAKYTRAGDNKYASIKMYPKRKLADVSAYATYAGTPPKIKMKVFTKAPVGTKVELQLGKRGETTYPKGVHSVYEAVTTVQNAWEELTFTFSHIPKETQVKPTEIDQITLMFAPNTATADTYYFDDISGPAVTGEAVTEKVK